MSFRLPYLFGFFLCLYTAGGMGQTVEVRISGVGGAVRDNVLAWLSLYQQRGHPRLNATRIKRLHRLAKDEIRAALEPFAFYRPQIETVLQRLPKSRNGEPAWLAEYRINPGDPLPLNTLDIRITGEAKDDQAFQALLEKFPLQSGDALEHAVYEKGKAAFLGYFHEQGYFDAVPVTKQIRINRKAYYGDIALHFNSGERYQFGGVSFSGSYYNADFLQPFIEFKSGSPYSSDALLKLQNNLLDSGYFRNVGVRALSEKKQGLRVPVEVSLEDRKPNRYSAFTGYGTDTGVRVGLGWERYRINHRGHRFKTDLRASEIGWHFNFNYVIPLSHPQSDYLSLSAAYQDEKIENGDSRLLLFGINHHIRQTLLKKWFGRAIPVRAIKSLEYRREDYQTGMKQDVSKLFMPAISWTYKKMDDPVYTQHGQSLTFGVRGALNVLLSDTNFLQADLYGLWIRPLGKRGRFIGRIRAGATITQAFTRLPATLRFFAGGDNSVRGYAYNSLGPPGEAGKTDGGRYLLSTGLEYEYSFLEKWGVAVFYDSGNAFNSLNGKLRNGTGVGVRWRSPIGPVRLDFAKPLEDSGTDWRIHLRIGPDL